MSWSLAHTLHGQVLSVQVAQKVIRGTPDDLATLLRVLLHRRETTPTYRPAVGGESDRRTTDIEFPNPPHPQDRRSVLAPPGFLHQFPHGLRSPGQIRLVRRPTCSDGRGGLPH